MSRFFYPSLKMKGVHHFGKFPGTEMDNLSPNTERGSGGDISGGDNPFKHEEKPADIGTLHSSIGSSDELSSTNTDVNFDPLADILGNYTLLRYNSGFLVCPCFKSFKFSVLWVFFVCLRPVSWVANVASFSGLFICDRTFGFL